MADLVELLTMPSPLRDDMGDTEKLREIALGTQRAAKALRAIQQNTLDTGMRKHVSTQTVSGQIAGESVHEMEENPYSNYIAALEKKVHRGKGRERGQHFARERCRVVTPYGNHRRVSYVNGRLRVEVRNAPTEGDKVEEGEANQDKQ